MIRWHCPKCKTALEAFEDAAGLKMDCTQCGTTVWVPEPEPEEREELVKVSASFRRPKMTANQRRVLTICAFIFAACAVATGLLLAYFLNSRYRIPSSAIGSLTGAVVLSLFAAALCFTLRKFGLPKRGRQ